MSRIASRALFLAVAAAGAAADLLTKTWAFRLLEADAATAYLPPGSVEIVPGFLQLRASVNPGSLWGLFREYPNVLLVVTIGIFGLLVTMAFLEWGRGGGTQLALGLFCAGAIGNLTDRVAYGHVRDFIDVYVGQYHWPTFNVADSCICVGAVIFLWTEWRSSKSPPSSAAGATDATPPRADDPEERA